MWTCAAPSRDRIALTPCIFESAKQHPALPTICRARILIVAERLRKIKRTKCADYLSIRESKHTTVKFPRRFFGYCAVQTWMICKPTAIRIPLP
jgi:hypothetical protein